MWAQAAPQRVAPWFAVALLCHAPLGWGALERGWSALEAAARDVGGARFDVVPIEVEPAAPAVELPAVAEQGSAAATDGDGAAATRKHRRRARRQASAPVPAALAVPAPPPPVAPAVAPPQREALADPLACLVGTEALQRPQGMRLLLHVDHLRAAPFAAELGAVLSKLAPYGSLFSAGTLDLVRDFDRLLLMGDQLDRPDGFRTIFDYNTPRYQIRQAITDPEAFTLPVPRTLVQSPRGQGLDLSSLKKGFYLPRPVAGELATLHIARPARALRALGWSLPESLRWLRVELTANRDGSARVALLARDTSAWAAAQSARALTTLLDAQLRGGQVSAERDLLHAELELDEAQLAALLKDLGRVLN
jgi:hypothetical protein